MTKINETIKKKFETYPTPLGHICKEIVVFSQNMPEPAVKGHLDTLIRKAVKQEELES